MKNILKISVLIFSLLLVLSCKDEGNYSKIKKTTVPSKNASHKIIVTEFLDGGNYLYLNVVENNNSYWMAIPNTKVKIGETYYYDGGATMRNFKSEQLKKTFDIIIFADGIRTSPKSAIKKQANPHKNRADSTKIIAIKIALPKGGISLKTLFSNPEKYAKKNIIVRGLVTKVNNGILKRNWVHIADGTQFDDKKNLTITTQELVKVGDTVTFKGKVILDKDFGKGYVYPILLEEGELIK